jgi:amino acid transporter
VTCYGYTTFLPGNFTVDDFFTYYMMLLVDPVLFIGWKLWKKTKFIKASEADLVWDKPIIDAYEDGLEDEHVGFWRDVGNMFGRCFVRKKKGDEEK